MTPAHCILCEGSPPSIVFIKTEEVEFVQCPKCGLIWRRQPESDVGVYDDGDYFSRMGYDKRRKRRVRKSKSRLNLIEKYHPTKGDLLDIGCSMGYFLEASIQKGWKAVGVDVSDYALNHCRNLGLEAYKPMELGELKFDAIVMKHVLEHFSNPIEVLKQYYDMLKPGGILFIGIPNPSYFKAVLLKEKSKFYSLQHGGRQHFYYYTPKTLTKLLESVGLDVILRCNRSSAMLDVFSLAKDFMCIARKKA